MNGKLKAVVLLALMYGFGAASGIAWQTYQNHHWFPSHVAFAEHRIQRLKRQLRLSPAQEQTLRDIFKKAHERANEINEEVGWDLSEIHRDSVQAIRQVLTPDQLRIFEKMHRRYHLRHKQWLDDDEEPPAAPVKAGL